VNGWFGGFVCWGRVASGLWRNTVTPTRVTSESLVRPDRVLVYNFAVTSDGKTQLLIENPLNRYLINSPMLPNLKKSPDGSLTLYIQKDSPGKAKESNWLPAPDGPIYLVMRLYEPKTEVPSNPAPGEGTWQPPPVKRVN